MSDKRLGTLMVAMLAGDEFSTIQFVGEVIGVADHPTLFFKMDGDGCQRHWAASLCRAATKDEQIEYWRARALRARWDGLTERRAGNDRRQTYGRREIDSR